jgi:hypothetical protein
VAQPHNHYTRCRSLHHASLPQPYQAALLDALAHSGMALPPRARQRLGQGPGPFVQLKRVLPMASALRPLQLGPRGRTSSPGAAGPFIFNPYAARRQETSAAATAETLLPDWVSGAWEEGGGGWCARLS